MIVRRAEHSVVQKTRVTHAHWTRVAPFRHGLFLRRAFTAVDVTAAATVVLQRRVRGGYTARVSVTYPPSHEAERTFASEAIRTRVIRVPWSFNELNQSTHVWSNCRHDLVVGFAVTALVDRVNHPTVTAIAKQLQSHFKVSRQSKK